jgi:enoyl-CoA hydratase/carnithine racemase
MAHNGLVVTRSESVVTLTLHRPPGNRVGLQTLEALAEAVAELAESDARAVLLLAKGSDFSHGADLTDPALANETRQDGGRRLAVRGQALVDAWANLPMPTVTSVRGWCIGAAATLVMSADFRFAASGARVSFPEVDRAVHLSWGMIPRLVALCGPAQARWLALGGESRTVESFRGGVFELAGDPDSAARTFAGELALAPPLAVRTIKATFNAVAAAGQEAAANDPDAFAQTVESADFSEAISSFFERREPRFTGK